jgi:two-component system chemotaxis response regulator CheY
MRPPVKHALVIDDAVTIRCFVRDTLMRCGFTVTEASNGMEGLEQALAADTPPDLLVVDVNMPRMDGYSLLRAVRTAPTLCDIPAIIMSTEREQHDSDRAYEAGGNLFLLKPVAPDVLGSAARILAGLGPQGTSEGPNLGETQGAELAR